ncbi:MAG: hypothetical protein ACFCU6_00945 [Balneolaceae bacterium]
MNNISILFWSGGKDSLLTLRELEKMTKNIALLTTYDEAKDIVPVQNIPIRTIQEQAIHLGYIHFAIPLPFPCSNDIYIDRITIHLKKLPFEIEHLVFGDLHLEDIKKWREKVFGEKGYNCLFPIWKKSEEELLSALDKEECTIKISSVSDKFRNLLTPGVIYNRSFVDKLPDTIDSFGENGEFHTEVVFEKQMKRLP